METRNRKRETKKKKVENYGWVLKFSNPAKTLETTNNASLCQAVPSKYFNLHLSPSLHFPYIF